MELAHSPFYSIYGEASTVLDPGFIHIEKVSERSYLHNGNVERHSHPHLHQLSLWTEGQGEYFIEQNGHSLKSTMISWMPSSTIHGFQISGKCDAIVISLSDEFLRTDLADIMPTMSPMDWWTPQLVSVDHAAAGHLKLLFDAIVREYSYPSLHQHQALVAQLQLIFISVLRIADAQDRAEYVPSDETRLFRRFMTLLNSRYRTIRTIDEYIAELATTPYLLNKAVKAATGQRPSVLLRQHLVLEAKRLLLFTAQNVGDVGYALGFGDTAHFGRFFRREVGLSPASWREKECRKLS